MKVGTRILCYKLLRLHSSTRVATYLCLFLSDHYVDNATTQVILQQRSATVQQSKISTESFGLPKALQCFPPV